MSRSTLFSFVAGAAAVGGVAVLVEMVGVAAGAWPRPHLLVLPAGVVATAVAAFLMQRSPDPVPFRLGALAVGVVALGSELVVDSGIGALQAVTAVSAGAVATVGPHLRSLLTHRIPPWAVAAGFVALSLVLIKVVVGGGELGHDEAAYALKARAWLSDTPDTGWSLHRGLGQSVLAAIVLPFSQSATALRLLSVALSLGTVVAVWALGRSVGSHRVGLLAAGVFAVAPSFLRRGAEFLTDIPSTGLLLVVAVLLWQWTRSTPPRPSLLYWAVGVGAAAFYIRYQAILSLGLLALAAAVVAGDRLRASLPAVGKAAGLGLLLLSPHLVYATATVGRPWGLITTTAEAGGRDYLGEGLVDYARDLPDLLAGQVGAAAILVAVVWFGWKMWSGDRRPALYLMIPALGQFLILGMVSHGEPRFVFFPVALMAVAAGMAADDLRRHMPSVVYRAGMAALVVALVASLALHGDRADRNAEARAESVEAFVEAADVVVSESEGRCGILTGHQPQFTWLSGCFTEGYRETEVEIPFGSSVDVFLVLAENGVRQPEGQLLDRYLAVTEGDPALIESDGSYGDVRVWQVDR